MGQQEQMTALLTVSPGPPLLYTNRHIHRLFRAGTHPFISYVRMYTLLQSRAQHFRSSFKNFTRPPDFVEKYKNVHFPMGYNIISSPLPHTSPLLFFQLVISAYHSFKTLPRKRSLFLPSKHFFAVLLPEGHTGTTINKRSSWNVSTRL